MYGYSQMNYPMPGSFWPRSMPGMSTTSQQMLLMQHQQQQAQQSQQHQPQQQAQQQQASVVGGQPIIIVNSQQPQLPQQPQSQGSIPIMTNGHQTMLSYEQKAKLVQQQAAAAQQTLINMGKIPGPGGKGKVGQKKAVQKRGGGPGR
jgi:hypothetical protein